MPPPGFEEDAALRDLLCPPDYRPRTLHSVLVVSYLLGKISPLALAPAWLALAAVASWPWAGLRIWVAGLSGAVILLDAIGLALLPRLGRSFGPVTPPLLGLTLVRTVITFSMGLAWGTLPALVALIVLQLAIAATSLYATWIEPFRIQITRAELQSSKLGRHPPFRLLHISDLHIEGITLRERRLVGLVEALDPDLVVLTGDYLNLSSVRDPATQVDARDLLGEVCERARGPVFAITGSPPVDLSDVVPQIFDGLPITWLLDDAVDLQLSGHTIRLIGLRCTRERFRDAPRLRRLLAGTPPDRFTLLLYHSPDLMPEAAELGVDLYLCGHTHGGQIRLPLIGALITSSDFGKRYEMGRYEKHGTTLYVSRGLGLEGLGAPRARFLCPPEVILWTLSGAENSAMAGPR